MRSGTINWQEFDDVEQMNQILEESFSYPVVIFKNSFRCGVSSGVWSELREKLQPAELSQAAFYHVDVVANRGVSEKIALTFNVKHESPQLLVICKGYRSLVRSHWDIAFEEVQRHLSELYSRKRA